MRNVGSFEATGDRLVVSDPCYDREVWCRGEVGGVLPGKWLGYAVMTDEKSWGMRVAELHAIHEKWADRGDDFFDWTKVPFEVGVDSGQAGIFDEPRYPQTNDDIGEYGELDTFYGRACEMTSSEEAGAIAEGLVSSSGFGDGGYPAYVARDSAGKAIAVKIIFIGEDDHEEEEDEQD